MVSQEHFKKGGMLTKLASFFAETLRWLIVFVVAMIIGVLLHAYVLEFFFVNGTSMLPTLHHADLVLVDKLSYRFRTPERGEVIAFSFPEDVSQSFVKRVIGIPGDTVAIQNGLVLVNERPLDEHDYTSEKPERNFAPVTVPAGTVFVLGDNRNNSEDSRFSAVGFVPTSLILGRGLFVVWPDTDFSSLTLPPDETITHVPAPAQGGML